MQIERSGEGTITGSFFTPMDKKIHDVHYTYPSKGAYHFTYKMNNGDEYKIYPDYVHFINKNGKKKRIPRLKFKNPKVMAMIWNVPFDRLPSFPDFKRPNTYFFFDSFGISLPIKPEIFIKYYKSRNMIKEGRSAIVIDTSLFQLKGTLATDCLLFGKKSNPYIVGNPLRYYFNQDENPWIYAGIHLLNGEQYPKKLYQFLDERAHKPVHEAI